MLVFAGVICTCLKSPIVNVLFSFIQSVDSFILSYICLCLMSRTDMAMAKFAIIVGKSE